MLKLNDRVRLTENEILRTCSPHWVDETLVGKHKIPFHEYKKRQGTVVVIGNTGTVYVLWDGRTSFEPYYDPAQQLEVVT